jgi:hypothetical protein
LPARRDQGGGLLNDLSPSSGFPDHVERFVSAGWGVIRPSKRPRRASADRTGLRVPLAPLPRFGRQLAATLHIGVAKPPSHSQSVNFSQSRFGPVYEKPTNAANLCPIYCGGAASYSRPRTTILHNDDGDFKKFFETWPPPASGARQMGASGLSPVRQIRTKRKMSAYSSDGRSQ